MNTIILNRRELDRIQELFALFNGPGDFGSVELTQEGDNGIGTTLNAKFYIKYKNVDGEFTVAITDEEHW